MLLLNPHTVKSLKLSTFNKITVFLGNSEYRIELSICAKSFKSPNDLILSFLNSSETKMTSSTVFLLLPKYCIFTIK